MSEIEIRKDGFYFINNEASASERETRIDENNFIKAFRYDCKISKNVTLRDIMSSVARNEKMSTFLGQYVGSDISSFHEVLKSKEAISEDLQYLRVSFWAEYTTNKEDKYYNDEISYHWDFGGRGLDKNTGKEINYGFSGIEDILDLNVIVDKGQIYKDGGISINVNLVGINEPPVNPKDKDVYIVGENPVGCFTNQCNKIAKWESNNWVFSNPIESAVVTDIHKKHYNFESGRWVDGYSSIVERELKPTLLEFLDAIYWEIGFYGSPAQTKEFFEELDKRRDEVEKDLVKTFPASEVFETLDKYFEIKDTIDKLVIENKLQFASFTENFENVIKPLLKFDYEMNKEDEESLTQHWLIRELRKIEDQVLNCGITDIEGIKKILSREKGIRK